jgi:hypothetical protein
VNYTGKKKVCGIKIQYGKRHGIPQSNNSIEEPHNVVNRNSMEVTFYRRHGASSFTNKVIKNCLLIKHIVLISKRPNSIVGHNSEPVPSFLYPHNLFP